jgi:hypothetical protein
VDNYLTGLESREVQAKSTNGSVRFDGRISRTVDMYSRRFRGQFRWRFPAESEFILVATTVNGAINTEFPIRVEGGNLGSERQLRGTAGNGGAEIIATGFSGPNRNQEEEVKDKRVDGTTRPSKDCKDCNDGVLTMMRQ